MTIFYNLSYFINFVLAQLNFLEEGLLNHAAVGFMESGRSANDLRNLLRKIEESEVYTFRMNSTLWIYLTHVNIIHKWDIIHHFSL